MQKSNWSDLGTEWEKRIEDKLYVTSQESL